MLFSRIEIGSHLKTISSGSTHRMDPLMRASISGKIRTRIPKTQINRDKSFRKQCQQTQSEMGVKAMEILWETPTTFNTTHLCNRKTTQTSFKLVLDHEIGRPTKWTKSWTQLLSRQSPPHQGECFQFKLKSKPVEG